jgi:tight adherence protein C
MELGILTFAVFALAAGGAAAIGTRAGAWRGRAIGRLAPRAPRAPSRPSTALVWRELAGRIGGALPASPGNLTLLKRRLVRAGFHNPSAAPVLQGARLALGFLLGAAGLAVALRGHAPAGNLLLGAGAAGMLGYMAPGQYLSWRIARRKRAIEKGLPNALDLMVVCVESGLGIDQTTIQVAKELQSAHPEIGDEFTLMNLELRAGKPRSEALHNMADRTGVDDMKKLVAVLVQTDRFGTSVAQCLRGHADYLRTMARQRAEERAAKLAVKLVFPIFFCVLPSLFVVTVGPVLTHLIRDLLPSIENM